MYSCHHAPAKVPGVPDCRSRMTPMSDRRLHCSRFLVRSPPARILRHRSRLRTDGSYRVDTAERAGDVDVLHQPVFVE
jgi:hypothetical protein